MTIKPETALYKKFQEHFAKKREKFGGEENISATHHTITQIIEGTPGLNDLWAPIIAYLSFLKNNPQKVDYNN